MRALEKSAEVVVAKKPGNAGGAKDRRSRTGPMVDSSAGSQHLRQRGEGNPPRTRHGRPTGGARQAGRAEIKSQRRRKPERKALYEARRASGDSNRRILKTVRPVVWEGAGAQSPAPDPIQLLPNMAHVAAVGSLVGRVTVHAEGHGGGLLLNQDLSLGHRTVAGGAFDLGVHGVQSV